MNILLQLALIYCTQRFQIQSLYNNNFLQRNANFVNFVNKEVPRTDFFIHLNKHDTNFYEIMIYEHRKNMPRKYLKYNESSSLLVLQEQESTFDLLVKSEYVKLKLTGYNKCLEVGESDKLLVKSCNNNNLRQKFRLKIFNKNSIVSQADKLNIEIENTDKRERNRTHHSDIINIRPEYHSTSITSESSDEDSTHDEIKSNITVVPEYVVNSHVSKYRTSTHITTLFVHKESTVTSTQINTMISTITKSTTNYTTITPSYSKYKTQISYLNDRNIPNTTRIQPRYSQKSPKYSETDYTQHESSTDNFEHFKSKKKCENLTHTQCQLLLKLERMKERSPFHRLSQALNSKLKFLRAQKKVTNGGYEKLGNQPVSYETDSYVKSPDDIVLGIDYEVEYDKENPSDRSDNLLQKSFTTSRLLRYQPTQTKIVSWTKKVTDGQTNKNDNETPRESFSGGLLEDPSFNTISYGERQACNDILCELKNSLI